MSRAGHPIDALGQGVRALLSGLADLAVPPLCPVCDRLVAGRVALCPRCWRAMGWIERPLCERLGTPLPFDTGGPQISPAALAEPPAWTRARAVVRYDAVSGALVHALKYRDRPELGGLLGGLMARAGRELLEPGAVLVPVPLHRLRLLSRRFNQSAVLAREVARLSGAGIALGALRRERATDRQVGLTRAERRRNVAGAFRVPPEQRPVLAGRPVVLVDDVLTSGATAEAATKALLRAGAARVDLLVFARVVTGS